MIPFAQTPQGIALRRRIDASTSRWAREDLSMHYEHARNHFESQQLERLASEQVDQSPAAGNPVMTIESTLDRIAVALETIAKNGGSVGGNAGSTTGTASGSTAATDAAAKKAAAAAKAAADKAAKESASKPKHTREELATVATEVREKFDADTARGIITEVGKAEKLKEVAEANIDALFDALKAKLEEGPSEEGAGGDL